MFYRGSNPPADDIDKIKRHRGVLVVDEVDRRALLVDASREAIEELRFSIPSWVIEEERCHPAP